jgi:hypothetical protein
MMMLFRCQLVPSIGSCSIVIFPIAIVHMVDTLSIEAVGSTTRESCNQKGESSSARHMVDWRHCPCASLRKLSNLYFFFNMTVNKDSYENVLCIASSLDVPICVATNVVARKQQHVLGTEQSCGPRTWLHHCTSHQEITFFTLCDTTNIKTQWRYRKGSLFIYYSVVFCIARVLHAFSFIKCSCVTFFCGFLTLVKSRFLATLTFSQQSLLLLLLLL